MAGASTTPFLPFAKLFHIPTSEMIRKIAGSIPPIKAPIPPVNIAATYVTVKAVKQMVIMRNKTELN